MQAYQNEYGEVSDNIQLFLFFVNWFSLFILG